MVSTFLFSQSPSVLWDQCLGGGGHEDAQAVIEMHNQQILAGGHTHSWDQHVAGYIGVGDLWLSCLSPSGQLIWQKCLGGSLFDEAKALYQTKDKNVVAVGFSESSDGDVLVNRGARDFWMIKTDSLGNLIWQKAMGSSGVDIAYGVTETFDGGIVAVGFSEYGDGDVSFNHGNNDLWVVRLDASGSLLWEKSFGGSGEDVARAVRPTSDGGFIIAGKTYSFDGDIDTNKGYSDAWLLKIDSMGNLLWQKTIGGSQNDLFYTLIELSPGYYIAAGESASTDGDISGNQGDKDGLVVYFDSTGSVIWQRCFGGSYQDFLNAATKNQHGSIVIAGVTGSNDGDVQGFKGLYDAWVISIDSAGTLQWQGCYGDFTYDWGSSIASTSDGGYVIGGQTLYSSTSLSGNHGAEDTWVFKIKANPSGIEEVTSTGFVKVYPNPASKELYVNVKNQSNYTLYDLQGQKISQGLLKMGQNSLDVSQLSIGMYLLKTSDQWAKFQVVR